MRSPILLPCVALLALLLLEAPAAVQAARQLSATQPQQGVSLASLQAQIQAELSPSATTSNSTTNSSSTSSSNAPTPIKPGVEFVTLTQPNRPPLPKSEQQLPGAASPNQQPTPMPPAEAFECGKPYMPCGSAIPAGKACPKDKGAGWCQKGYYCGFESTSAEPSRCLPLPEKCGTAGHPCCPSNADSPHSGSLQDKLERKPFCRDGSTCFYFPPVDGLNNGDSYAGNKGVYACTAVPPECGTAAGSPCCPFADKISTNPPLPRTGCGSNTSLFCNYDVVGLPKAVLSVKPEYLSAAVSGTCEANAADCSQFGKSCCVTTGPTSTSFVCGARWNETGQRGYCADPFANRASVGPRAGAGGGARALVDGSNTSSNSNNTSTNSSSGASGPGPGGDPRRASFKELVCTPCPARSDSVADNPSKYWPC